MSIICVRLTSALQPAWAICWLRCRVDHMASYGQLVGQPAYDDSGLFDRHGAAPAGEAASSSRSTPALKVIVTDPLKKVSCCSCLTTPELVLSGPPTLSPSALPEHVCQYLTPILQAGHLVLY